VTTGQSILRQLCLGPCDPSELEQVLLRRYGSSGGDRNNTRALLFPGDQEQYSVRLVFDKKYALKDAEAGPRLSDLDVSELHDLIKREILTPGPPKVATWTLFAALPVSGCFRWNDDFQILPVPQDAPRPEFLLADHPFLLQFRFAGSSNGMVEQARRHRRGLELELLLSGLVANHIRSDRTTVHRWVILPPAGDPPRIPPSILSQMGYHYEGSRGVQDAFTACDDVSALKSISPAEYYAGVGIRSSQEMELPATFAAGIEAYTRLSPPLRRKFLNSCAWLQHSHTVFHASQSASYMALVLAVEALMPPPESGRSCEACKRSVGKGPTQRFKEFLAKLAPTGEAFSGELGRFYEIRSKLVHGGGLLLSDREFLGSTGLEGFEDWQRRFRLHQFVQIAIVNWLFWGSQPG
jgi:hypothetical protein